METVFPTISFGEAPFEIIDGDRGVNYPKGHEFSEIGHCLFLNAGNVTDRGFVFETNSFITEAKDTKLGKGKLRREDVVLTTRGTVGNVGFYSDDVSFEHIRINSGMVILRADPERISPKYLFAFLRSDSFKQQVLSLRSGSAQPQLPIRDMRKIRIPLPTIEEQGRIINVYYSLDDKIELNRRMNATLEAMARALFKAWFVDFEPVHANLENRPSTAASPELAKLFPSDFENGIPKGWHLGALENLCSRVESGGTPSRKNAEYWADGSIPWLTSGEVRKPIVLETREHISLRGYKNSNTKIWPAGTTVVAMYGATAGEVCLLANDMTANQACCGLIPKDKFRTYLFEKASQSKADLANKSSGSAQQNLNKSLVANFPSILPNEDCALAYEQIAGEWLNKRTANEREAEILAEILNSLLPRLIGGRISTQNETHAL